MRLIIIDDKNRLESIFESPDMFKKDKFSFSINFF